MFDQFTTTIIEMWSIYDTISDMPEMASTMRNIPLMTMNSKYPTNLFNGSHTN